MRSSNRETHFLVTELVRDELDNVLFVEIEAVLTKRVQRLDWHDLSDAERW
ncbi:TIGR02450 family Trp-rich protein [Metapseudomonas boanensis]|uniref:TIGR02450 family Trp-rich protein n=1 Tax=Metapseudomonas boanensis TaxID=2822138 RepID=UPI0037447C0C